MARIVFDGSQWRLMPEAFRGKVLDCRLLELCMSLLIRCAAVLLVSGGMSGLARADASSAALPGRAVASTVVPAGVPAVVPFASAEGWQRLGRASAHSDFAPLANQFEPQATLAFCAPATAAIVLNALDPEGVGAGHDRSRLTPAESRSLPPGGELTDRRYTQESVIAAGRKPRAQVLGEPVRVNGRMLSDGGYQLRQLDELLRAQRVATRLVIVDERMSEAEIRRDLVDNLQRPGDYVIVNYLRAALGQAGGGHISPLGAYDAATDSVLILDVHPSHYPWVWVPLATLVQGMRTRDMNENRGYILARPR